MKYIPKVAKKLGWMILAKWMRVTSYFSKKSNNKKEQPHNSSNNHNNHKKLNRANSIPFSSLASTTHLINLEGTPYVYPIIEENVLDDIDQAKIRALLNEKRNPAILRQ